MKIIHTADIHLGSRLTSIKDLKLRDQLRVNARKSFVDLVKFAENNKVDAILLSGDIFDKDSPSVSDKKVFYDTIKSYENITFFYLKGNHDLMAIDDEELPNLKTFKDEWTSFQFKDVVISGVELNNVNNKAIYQSLNLNKDDINIVLLHGAIEGRKEGQSIDLNTLKNKNIDYLALGHIHQKSNGKLDERGQYVYPGCLIAHGYDEDGEVGFYLLDIDDKKITSQFIKWGENKFHNVDVDISDASTTNEIEKYIESKTDIYPNDSFVHVNLVGIIDPNLIIDIELLKVHFENKFQEFVIKDRVKYKTIINENDNVYSFRKIFMDKVRETDLDEETKNEIISLGLKAMKGELH